MKKVERDRQTDSERKVEREEKQISKLSYSVCCLLINNHDLFTRHRQRLSLSTADNQTISHLFSDDFQGIFHIFSQTGFWITFFCFVTFGTRLKQKNH